MAIAFVQAASNTGTSTVTVTLSSTTAGNCLVACIALGSASSLSSVSSVTLGGAADNWAQLKAAGDLTTGAEQLAVWADLNCAGGQTAVAITLAGGASVSLAWVFEFSGLATASVLDQSGTFDSGGGSAATFSVSTGGATAQASELAVGCVYGYNQTITGPSSPWVNQATITSTTRNLQAGYQILSATGTVTYAGSFGGSTFNGQILVTLKAPGSPQPPAAAAAATAPAPLITGPGVPAPPAAPLPLIIPPHPLFTRMVLEAAQQRADWQGRGVADLTVAYASTSSGVDTYNVTSPYNGTGTHPMRVLNPTAPNPGYQHAFLLMLPVEKDLDTLYGDSISTAVTLAVHNNYNLTCVAPGYAGLPVSAEGPWYSDNPLNQVVSQEKFTLLITGWVRQHLAVTGTEQVYLIGFSRSGLGASYLQFRHPYTYAAVACWDTPYGMSDYDGTNPIRGSPNFGDPQGAYGTSVNFTTNYWLSPAHLAAWASNGQFARNRIWMGNGAANQPDFAWYDGQLTTAGIPHTATFSNIVEAHAWQPDWMAAGVQAIVPSSEPTILPQQHASHPLFTRLLEVAAYRRASVPATVTPSVPAPVIDLTAAVSPTASRAQAVPGTAASRAQIGAAGAIQDDGTEAGAIQDDGTEAGPTIVNRSP